MTKNIRPAFHSDGKTDEVSGLMRERSVRRPVSVAGGLLGAEYAPKPRNALSGRFIAPPFTILNAREGWWQDRKRAWLGLGIRSELGRGENLLKFSDTVMAAQAGKLQPKDGQGLTWNVNDPDQLRKREKKKRLGQAGNLADAAAMLNKKGSFATAGKSAYLLPPSEDGENVLTGTSIFDPVLCEICYRWFAPEGGYVLDPFSGGSVRGIVAGELGLQYTGIDLSGRQVEANKQQAIDIGTNPAPIWFNGDSRAVLEEMAQDAHMNQEEVERYDFIFSCPPYGDLEVYSEDENDISNMSVDGFDEAYADIIRKAATLLKPDRFACFVVGDYRNKADGFYQNLPAKTIAFFEDAGLRLYNEAILITAIGSLPMRINAQFNGSRKLGKTHQNVLVFAKGQPRDFVKTFGKLIEKEIK